MKISKNLIAVLVTGMFFLASNLMAQTIVGTPHDISDVNNGNSGQGVCETCHTPHGGDITKAAPLWNHQTTSSTFSMYNNSAGTQDTTPAADGAMSGISEMCLSCHDGTIAIKNFGGVTTETLYMGDAPYFDNNPNALLGTDLSNDHPIEIIYDDNVALADGGLWYPSVATSGLGGTIQNDMLFTDKIACASCHDVHDFSNGKFLRITNTNSTICLTCHNK